MQTRIAELVKLLNLKPHPEGGFYNETQRDSTEVNYPINTEQTRSAATAIYFLLESGDFSSFHKIPQQETWFYHEGAPVHLYFFTDKLNHVLIGGDITQDNNAHYQFTVPANTWFAARVEAPDTYSLVSCTVAPAFLFEDLEFAKRDELVKAFPEQQALIDEFTRDNVDQAAIQSLGVNGQL